MLHLWDESSSHSREEDHDDLHASLTHDEIHESGVPVRPLEFPTPVVHEGDIVDITAADHLTGTEYDLKNVLKRVGNTDVAYLMKKKIAKSCYGFVWLGVVLRRISTTGEKGGTFKAKWQSSGDFVAIKVSSWGKIQSLRGRHLADPIKEISVLQLIGNVSAEQHVMGCIEVLQDHDNLYTIMPYCPNGDLYGKLALSGLQLYPDEEEARRYFQQLIKVRILFFCFLSTFNGHSQSQH
jgi:serine/threonine protein kinase